MTDRSLRRAGLDYLAHVALSRHGDWLEFQANLAVMSPRPRVVLATTKAVCRIDEFAFHRDDVLLLGRESAGVPEHVHQSADERVRIPMREGLRSLNIAVAAALVLGEALRQTSQWPG